MKNATKIKRFIRKNSEFLTIPLALTVWYVFKQYCIRNQILDIYNDGIFQKLVFAFVAILVIKAFAWFMISIDQPYLKKYLDSDNETKWEKLTESEKMVYASLFFLFYFLMLTLIVVLT